MLKIGHRGAKGYVAENTLASFQKAMELNVDAIELDVHFSLDGRIMVIHDDSIDRTTVGKGLINQLEFSFLNQIGVPTLENVLDLIDKKCSVNIEIKDKKATYSVMDLIQKYSIEKNWNRDLFQISSFDKTILETLSNSGFRFNLGVLVENNLNDEIIDFAKKINAFSINSYFGLLNEKNVKQIQQIGFKVFAWTVNAEKDISRLKTMGVDGIISDYPDRL